MKKPFLNQIQKNIGPPPIWLMRQAGRYMEEYRAIRANFPSFLDLVFSPKTAAEVTLQPIHRFGFDAAILFSDILVVPLALGWDVKFLTGEGPVLSGKAGDFDEKNFLERLAPVFQTIKLVKSALPAEKTLLGFAGVPLTLALYILEGSGSKDFAKAKAKAFQNPQDMACLLDRLTDATILYLDEQIRAGVEGVQLFESWAGCVPESRVESWILEPTQRIFTHLKRNHPHIPLIGFAKNLGVHLENYVKSCKPDVISLDSTFPLEKALDWGVTVQGNLDPACLVAGGGILSCEVQRILNITRGKRFIFNLGHGILPQTPVEHVVSLIDQVRSFGSHA